MGCVGTSKEMKKILDSVINDKDDLVKISKNPENKILRKNILYEKLRK